MELGVSSLAHSQQYLTFRVCEEEYGVDILNVQEIRGWEKVTPLPDSDDFVKGIINLRGEVVPIVDLRMRFAQQDVVYDSTTVVIVMRMEVEDGSIVLGLVVDAVSDVHTIASSDINSKPSIGSQGKADYIYGIALVNESNIVLLNVDSLFDVQAIKAMAQTL